MDQLPEVIKVGMPKIIESTIKLMHKYTKEREREKIEDLEDQLMPEPENPEEAQNKKSALEKLRQVASSEPEEDDEEEELDLADDDDYLWSRSDSYYYKSKFEELEAPLYFRDTLTKMKEERNENYDKIAQYISEENKNLLENIFER